MPKEDTNNEGSLHSGVPRASHGNREAGLQVHSKVVNDAEWHPA